MATSRGSRRLSPAAFVKPGFTCFQPFVGNERNWSFQNLEFSRKFLEFRGKFFEFNRKIFEFRKK